MLSKEKDLLYVYQQWVIPEALFYFQLIEQSLKEVLRFYHEIIKIRTREIFIYDYSESSIDDAAMGRLIEMFKIFYRDDEMIKLLKSVKKDRDYLAHKGYLVFKIGEKSKFLVQKEICKIQNIINKSSVVLRRLKIIETDLQKKLMI
ncbi:hypothetical protein [Hydrogenimonas sp.]